MNSTQEPSLPEYWSRVLQTRGGDLAVNDFAAGSRHTFAQVECEAQRIEAELRTTLAQSGHSDCKGRVILLALPNGARWLAAYLAICRLKGVIAAIEPEPAGSASAAKQTALGQQLQALAIIEPDSIRVFAESHRDSTAAKPANGAQSATPDTPAKPETAIAAAQASHITAAANAKAQTHLVKLTSGSTGQPQALRFSEANMIADGQNIIATMGLRADMLNYAVIPFGHSYGLGNLVLPFFLQGTAIACASGILPRIVAQEIARAGASFFPAVPTLIRALCAAEVDPQQLATLERVISAGSALAPDLARAFEALYGKRVHNFYGSSETGGICFDASGEATLSGRSIGTPLRNVRVDVNAEGRVRVQSQAVCAHLADAQQRVLLPDHGTLLADGELRLEGRSGRQIKIGARRLDLNSWEAQARTLPGVEDAFACTATRSGGEVMLCAALQTSSAADTVRQQLAAHFPRWQQPARLLTFAIFPQTARGKTDTAALRQQLDGQEHGQTRIP